MAEELGRMERPSAEPFKQSRKLLLVPRLPEPPDSAEGAAEIAQRYWSQVYSQVASLEARLGRIGRVYHETLTEGGSEGLERVHDLDAMSHIMVEPRCNGGAILEATEDQEILAEALDLQRCLMMPFMSNKVASALQEWFGDTLRRRYQHMSSRIESTLGQGEVGLLVVSERHQVQFPADVEVFFVAPPALDEFRRCMEDWAARQRASQSASVAAEPDAPGADDA